MSRNVGLKAISDRQRAARAAEGELYPTSTFRRKPGKAVAGRAKQGNTKRRPTATGPDQATVDAVLQRDGYQCVRCGGALWGDRGEHWSIQHRRARGNGGTQRPDANAPQTLIATCGSATTGCHGHIEAHPAEAEAHGWRIANADDPLLKPVQHSLHGWVFLTADGGWTRRRPNQSKKG